MTLHQNAGGLVAHKLLNTFKRYEPRVTAATSRKLVFIDRSGASRLEFETMPDLVGVVRATHLEDGFPVAMRYIYMNTFPG